MVMYMRVGSCQPVLDLRLIMMILPDCCSFFGQGHPQQAAGGACLLCTLMHQEKLLAASSSKAYSKEGFSPDLRL
jgi:hypothetical protein